MRFQRKYLRALACCMIVSVVGTVPAGGQPGAEFGGADVHASAHTTSPYMRGPFVRAGRYEIRTATMVDLIRTAWGVAEDKVLGGPDWLEADRFDIAAKLPAETTPESLKAALQSLLKLRFGLAVHADSKEMPAWVLTAGKKPQIKEADPAGEPGCRNTTQGGRGAGPVALVTFACRNVSMEAFATAMTSSMGMVASTLSDAPVVDRTGLKGEWDFDIRISPLRIGGGAETENVTIFEALDKQLGMKLQEQNIAQPVVVVDAVERTPTPNLPGVSQIVPTAPVGFEVADVKPSDPAGQPGSAFSVQPNGRVNLRHLTLKFLIQLAYNLNNAGNNDAIVGAPKWLDTEYFDIVAKVAASESANGSKNNVQIDTDAVWFALRGLLADRFRLAAHFEDQPRPVYALVAVKPKLSRADPANRSSCKSPNIIRAITSTGPGGSPATNTLTCTNTTMAQLADRLLQVSFGDVDHPVADETAIEGAWDFALTWTPAAISQMAANRARNAGAAGDSAAASDPGGGVTMAQALEKQLGLKLELRKRPMPVLVIDHVEQKPTDN